MPKRFALIPARTGSKRLKDKNKKLFFGKAMFLYSVEAAIKSELFDEIIVSSNDREIRDLCNSYNIRFMFRDGELANYDKTVVELLSGVLKVLEQEGKCYEEGGVLYATAPMRNASDIQKTFSLLRYPGCSFAIATKYYQDPVNQALIEGKNGFKSLLFKQLNNLSKLKDEIFEVDNGSTYAFDVEAFKSAQSFYGHGNDLLTYRMPQDKSVDIDTEFDFEFATFLQSYNKK